MLKSPQSIVRILTIRIVKCAPTEVGIYKRDILRKKKKTRFRPRKKERNHDLDQEKKENKISRPKKSNKTTSRPRKKASFKIFLFFFYRFPPLFWAIKK